MPLFNWFWGRYPYKLYDFEHILTQLWLVLSRYGYVLLEHSVTHW
jgi:hypothetical protein